MLKDLGSVLISKAVVAKIVVVFYQVYWTMSSSSEDVSTCGWLQSLLWLFKWVTVLRVALIAYNSCNFGKTVV